MPGVQLFSDLCFFIVQRVPFRGSLIKDIEHHGGRIVNLERLADYVIADHVRKDAPAGSLSYTWIHEAIKAGELRDPNLHLASRAAPVSSARIAPSGTAMSRPAKSTRTPFTAEDDICLWNWVRDHGTAGNLKGNEMYKALEIQNPRHTFQSWRDRYVKILSGRPPPGVDATNGPPTPPSEPAGPSVEPVLQPHSGPRSRMGASAVQPSWAPRSRAGPSIPVGPATASRGDPGALPHPFTKRDVDDISKVADDIDQIKRKDWLESWRQWAELDDDLRSRSGMRSRNLTAQDWADFYDNYAQPEIERRRAAKRRAEQTTIPQADGAVASIVSGVARPPLPGITDYARETIHPDHPEASPQGQHPPPSSRKRPAIELDRETRTLEIDAILEEARHEPPLKKRNIPAQSPASRLEEIVKQMRPPSINSPPARSAFLGSSSAKLPANKYQGLSSSITNTRSSTAPVKSNLVTPVELPTSMRAMPAQSPQESPSVRASLRHSASVEPPVTRSIRTPRALTEANLAQMSRQQRGGQIRANDLNIDDPAKDQTQFAEALQRLIPGDFLPDLPPGAPQDETEEIPESLPGSIERLQSSSATRSPELGSSPDLRAVRTRRHPRDSSVPMSVEDSTPRQAHNTRISENHQLLHSASRPGRRLGSRNAFAQGIPIASSPPIGLDVFEQIGFEFEAPVELNLSEPESGLYNHLSSEISEHATNDLAPSGLKINQDTQGIFIPETQELDLSIPELDKLVAEGVEEERLNRRKADYLRRDTRAPSPIPMEGEDVDEFIASKVKEGFKEAHVIQALEAGSMRMQPTEDALKFLHRTGQLPKGLAGIWSPKDDKDAESGDPARVAAVERQHGSRELSRRLEFLAAWRG